MNGDHDINGSWRQILVALLIAALSSSIGFGVSQMTVIKDVTRNSADIAYLQKGDAEEHQRTDNRINEIVGQMKEQLKLNSEIIDLVKVQNQLLSRERK